MTTETSFTGTEWWRLDQTGLATELRTREETIRRLQAQQGAIIAEMQSRGPLTAFGYADVTRIQMDVLTISRRDARARTRRAFACNPYEAVGGTIPAAAPETGRAFAAGAIGAEHVDVLRDILGQIPGDIPPDDRTEYEEILVRLARTSAPGVVRDVGQRLIDMLDTDGKEPHDREQVKPERELLWHWRDGTLKLTGILDTETGKLLEALLSPLAKPRPTSDGDRDTRTVSQRHGDAFAELLDAASRAADLPTENGEKPALFVTMTLEQLLRNNPHITAADATTAMKAADPRLRPHRSVDTTAHAPALAATPDGTSFGGRAHCTHCATPEVSPAADQTGADQTGAARNGAAGGSVLGDVPPMLNWTTPITAEAARRLACDARIIPAVLGSNGEVLDLGRAVRTATLAQRRALALRDRGCIAPGCTRPVRWTQIHHIRKWTADEGPSDLDNMCLLCAYHHRLIHHSDWEIRIADDGRPDCIPPAWIDPERKPRRNYAHHPPPTE